MRGKAVLYQVEKAMEGVSEASDHGKTDSLSVEVLEQLLELNGIRYQNKAF